MAFPVHTRNALTSVMVNTPEVIVEVARAHDRPGSPRIAHLFEAQRRLLDMLGDVQNAISVEQAQCGEAAVPQIAARMRAVAQQKG